MTIQVVDCFQVIDIADHDCERPLLSRSDLFVDFLFPLVIGSLVFYTCQRINHGHSSGCCKILFRMGSKFFECLRKDSNFIVFVVFQREFIISVLHLLCSFRKIAQRFREMA